MSSDTRPPSASAIAGNMSTEAALASSCRPPWLDTKTPSAPISRASNASWVDMIPLRTRCPDHARRINRRSSQEKQPATFSRTNAETSVRDAFGRTYLLMFGHFGCPLRNRLAAQLNFVVACMASRSEGRNGTVTPLNKSKVRFAFRGASKVTTSTDTPAFAARCIRSKLMAWLSRGNP